MLAVRLCEGKDDSTAEGGVLHFNVRDGNPE
jgi:hypothetical protein